MLHISNRCKSHYRCYAKLQMCKQWLRHVPPNFKFKGHSATTFGSNSAKKIVDTHNLRYH